MGLKGLTKYLQKSSTHDRDLPFTVRNELKVVVFCLRVYHPGYVLSSEQPKPKKGWVVRLCAYVTR